jgi:hypothetical protein
MRNNEHSSKTKNKNVNKHFVFQYAFVGDYSGQISVLKITDSNFELIIALKGHSGEEVI